MSYFNFKKKFFLNFLTSTSLSLAILSPVHAADEETLPTISSKLRASECSTANEAHLSPDEKFSRAQKKFDEAQNQFYHAAYHTASNEIDYLQKKIEIERNYISLLEECSKEGSVGGTNTLYDTQYSLAMNLLDLERLTDYASNRVPLIREALALLKKSETKILEKPLPNYHQERDRKIPLVPSVQCTLAENLFNVLKRFIIPTERERRAMIEEALELTTASVDNGMIRAQQAQFTISTLRAMLVSSLERSAKESPEEIPLLIQTLKLASENTADFKFKKNLPHIQNRIAIFLAESAKESPEDISLLTEALELATKSANADFPKAKENLLTIQAALDLAIASADAAFSEAKKNLPVIQNHLVAALVSSEEQSSQHPSRLIEEGQEGTLFDESSTLFPRLSFLSAF